MSDADPRGRSGDALADWSPPAFPPSPVRERIDRLTALYPAALLAALLPVAALSRLLGTETALAVGAVAFLLGTLAVGMAHGAVDHLVPLQASETPLRRSLAVVSVVYALLGGAVLVAWWRSPPVAFAGFVLLTWLHWGQGDVAALAFAGVEHLRSRGERLLALVVRGGLPMAVPLVFHPAEYRLVAATTVGLFGVDAAAVDPAFTPAVRVVLGASLASATLLSLGVGAVRVRRGADRDGWVRDCAETGVLWTWFVVVTPTLAIGVYFALWHALRHVGRLAALDERAVAAVGADDLRGAAGRFARDAAPLTLGGFLVVAAVAVAVPAGVASTAAVLGVALVGIAAMTLPHVFVTAWLDRRQGVWTPVASAGNRSND